MYPLQPGLRNKNPHEKEEEEEEEIKKGEERSSSLQYVRSYRG